MDVFLRKGKTTSQFKIIGNRDGKMSSHEEKKRRRRWRRGEAGTRPLFKLIGAEEVSDRDKFDP